MVEAKRLSEWPTAVKGLDQQTVEGELDMPLKIHCVHHGELSPGEIRVVDNEWGLGKVLVVACL